MRELYMMVMAELRGSWRYRWIAATAAWLVCVIGWIVVYSIPDSYESKATVYIDTSSALRPILSNLTIDSDVLSRVEQVSLAMLGRPQLERVARQTDLHLRATNQTQMDRLIAGMRARTSIGTPDRREPNLYELSYRDVNPNMAQTVVNTLLNSFVEDSLGGNRQDTQMAQRFLRDQLQTLEAELVQAESRLAEFKRENVGRMPSEGGGYFDRLQNEMEALDNLTAERQLAERRRDVLRQQLSGETPLVNSGNSMTEDIDARISQNEDRLEELQLRFTDLHPDVIAVKDTLEQLRAQRQTALDSIGGNSLGAASENPVYQNIQIELTNVNVEIATLMEREQALTRKIADLRGMVDVLPDIEAELVRLNRDYDVKQTQYQSLLQRLEVAELSESAEQTEDVKFQIIDPPTVSNQPVAPNRPLLLVGVLAAGLAVGGGIAFIANQFRPVFSDVKSLRQATGFPVLGSIVSMKTDERRARQVSEIRSFAIVMGSLFGVFVLVFLLQGTGSRIIQSFV